MVFIFRLCDYLTTAVVDAEVATDKSVEAAVPVVRNSTSSTVAAAITSGSNDGFFAAVGKNTDVAAAGAFHYAYRGVFGPNHVPRFALFSRSNT